VEPSYSFLQNKSKYVREIQFGMYVVSEFVISYSVSLFVMAGLKFQCSFILSFIYLFTNSFVYLFFTFFTEELI
jgi:hypothetical protein